MRRCTVSIIVLCLCSFFTLADAAVGEHQPSMNDDKPINAMCPIGKEPIISSAGTVNYQGHTIGLCCPGCGKEFLAWEAARRDAFVQAALQGTEPGQETHGKKTAQKTNVKLISKSHLYPFGTCIVADNKLGEHGKPVVVDLDGRQVKLCCLGCNGALEEEQETYLKKLDEMIAKDQRRFYPTIKCIVTDEDLIIDGNDIAEEFMYENRLIRVCCMMCKTKFQADPDAYIKKLDNLVIKAQREDYPLDWCIVAGTKSKLGSMGEPTELIIGGRLLRFCCASCEARVEANPAKYLAMLDAAWNKDNRFMPEKPDGPERKGGGKRRW